MPYIKTEYRKVIEIIPQSVGELNYVITKICDNYKRSEGESYQTYNDIIGALEGAKLELYRRKIAPYEDKKIVENGDVY